MLKAFSLRGVLKTKFGNIESIRRRLSSHSFALIDKCLESSQIRSDIGMKPANLDWSYILNPAKLHEIEKNSQTRKGLCDIRSLVKI